MSLARTVAPRINPIISPGLYKLLGSVVARVARVILGNTAFWLAGGPEVLQGCYKGATCSMLHPSCLLV